MIRIRRWFSRRIGHVSRAIVAPSVGQYSGIPSTAVGTSPPLAQCVTRGMSCASAFESGAGTHARVQAHLSSSDAVAPRNESPHDSTAIAEIHVQRPRKSRWHRVVACAKSHGLNRFAHNEIRLTQRIAGLPRFQATPATMARKVRPWNAQSRWDFSQLHGASWHGLAGVGQKGGIMRFRTKWTPFIVAFSVCG